MRLNSFQFPVSSYKISRNSQLVTRNSPRVSERGNVFVFILIAIVLFAALAFTISRGFQSTTTKTLSARQAELAASDILDYAQKLERTVNRLRTKGCSESEISFENPTETGYAFSTRDQCKVFDKSGGGLAWEAPPKNANDGSPYNMSASVWISGVGVDGSGSSCTTLGNCNELIVSLPNIDLELCKTINKRAKHLNTDGTPPVDTNLATNNTTNYAKFTGDFKITTNNMGVSTPTDYEGFETGCFEGDTSPASGTYHFYHVLIAR